MMENFVRAVYTQGAFIPESPCDLPDGTEVVLDVQRTNRVRPPEVASPEERQSIIRSVVERMKANPLPLDAPHLTRDQMHERR